MQKTIQNELVKTSAKTKIKSVQKYVKNKNEHIQN